MTGRMGRWMRKAAWCCLPWLTLACGPRAPRYGILEGPPRLDCKPFNAFATVGQLWPVYCIVNGDLTALQDRPVTITVTRSREEYNANTVTLPRLQTRAVAFQLRFSYDYYYLIMGRGVQGQRIGPSEIIPEDDPRFPLPGIEGFDEGSNLFHVTFTLSTGGERLAKDIIHGRLQCNDCPF